MPALTVTDKILDIVRNSPGTLTRKAIVKSYPEKQQHSINVTIGIMLSNKAGGNKLQQVGGKLYLFGQAPEPTVDLTVFEAPIDEELVAETPVEVAEQLPPIQTQLVKLSPHFRERHIDVHIETHEAIFDAARIGFSNEAEFTQVQWLAPGGRIFLAQVGDVAVDQTMEPVSQKFLVLLTRTETPDEYAVQYRERLVGQEYFVSWPKS